MKMTNIWGGAAVLALLAGTATAQVAALGDFITKAYLANGGLTQDDIEDVAVPNFPRMWASFAEGTSDVTIVVVGAGNSRECDATFGITYLSYDDSPEAIAAMNEYLPQSYLQTLDETSGIPGITEPTNVNVFDYVFFAGADVSDDMVYTATKALWEKRRRCWAAGRSGWTLPRNRWAGQWVGRITPAPSVSMRKWASGTAEATRGARSWPALRMRMTLPP